MQWAKKGISLPPAVYQLWTTKVMETKVTAMGLPILTWIIKHPNCNSHIHIIITNVKQILEDKMKSH
jgi:hypothetical protein